MHSNTNEQSSYNSELSQSEIHNPNIEQNFIKLIEDLHPSEQRYHFQQSLNLIKDIDINYLFTTFIRNLTQIELSTIYNQTSLAIAGAKS